MKLFNCTCITCIWSTDIKDTCACAIYNACSCTCAYTTTQYISQELTHISHIWNESWFVSNCNQKTPEHGAKLLRPSPSVRVRSEPSRWSQPCSLHQRKCPQSQGPSRVLEDDSMWKEVFVMILKIGTWLQWKLFSQAPFWIMFDICSSSFLVVVLDIAILMGFQRPQRSIDHVPRCTCGVGSARGRHKVALRHRFLSFLLTMTVWKLGKDLRLIYWWQGNFGEFRLHVFHNLVELKLHTFCGVRFSWWKTIIHQSARFRLLGITIILCCRLPVLRTSKVSWASGG